MKSTVVLVVVILLLPISGAKAELNATQFIYEGFSGADLTTDYEASVADGLLILTSGQRSKGHGFRTYPLNLTLAAAYWKLSAGVVPSFSTTFVFSVLGQQQHDGPSSDGLAFVLSSTKDIFNDLPSQYLGLVDSWGEASNSNSLSSSIRLLAVELDTVLNAELRDVDGNHVGIDVDSLVSVASREAGYYDDATRDVEPVFRPLSIASGEPTQVWVDYDSRRAVINVTMAPYTSSSAKPSRPLLSITHNLTSVLPSTTVHAGFSSASGGGVLAGGSYVVLGWSFKLNGEAEALNYSALPIQALQQNKRPRQPRKNRYKKTLPAVVLPTAAVVATLLVAVKLFLRKKSKNEQATDRDWEMEYGPPSFTYKDLVAATNGFRDEALLGRGGFGSVYKGVLPLSQQEVAVKRVSPESRQGMREFMAEIAILGHVRHRNLVQLLGYCRHEQHLLLVYDYMPNGSLDSYLHLHIDDPDAINNNSNVPRLCWDRRFRIIRGVASGLLYLHEEWEQVVIHRDVKTSNVLLDADMNARLGDFGLARSHDHGADANTTFMAGTWGYMAPELAMLGKATKATDVFALGVLMMVVACARRPVSRDALGEPLTLADWVLTAWRRGSIADAADPRLLVEEDGHPVNAEEVELVLKLGLLCSHPSPNARPSMRLVMKYLQRDANLPDHLTPFSLPLTRDVSSQQEDDQHAGSCPPMTITDDDQHAISCPSMSITDLSRGR